MKKIILLTMLSLTPFVQAVNFQQNIDPVTLNGKVMTIDGENVTLNFVSDEKVVLETTCYDAEGLYTASIIDGVVSIDFALKNYNNVSTSCDISEREKSITTTALHSLNWNKSVEFKMNKNFEPIATFYGDNGSITTYKM